MSKYPKSERVTAGKLQVGDRLLVRARQEDRIHLEDRDDTRNFLPVGEHYVAKIESRLVRSGYSRRARRTYRLELAGGYVIEVDPALRLNRIL